MGERTRAMRGLQQTFSLALPGLKRPSALTLPGPHFACLFACDARLVDDVEIAGFVAALLGAGLVYLCAWGPRCERMHDPANRTLVRRESKTGVECSMMAWHADEEGAR